MDNWDMSEDEIDEGGYVTEVFLNVRDDKQILRDNAYGGDSFIVVATSPNQIKSATENIGTYNKANDDIRYSINRDEITDIIREEAKKAVDQWLAELSTVVAPNTLTKALPYNRFERPLKVCADRKGEKRRRATELQALG